MAPANVLCKNINTFHKAGILHKHHPHPKPHTFKLNIINFDADVH